MANKGSSKHMKSLTAPRYYAVHKKETAYSAKPSPGRHTLDMCIPLVAFATKAGISASSHDASRMIKRRELVVNGKAVRDPAYPVGLNDIIEVTPAKKSYEIGINERGQVSIGEAGKKGSGRVCKIVQKYKTGKNVLMVRLHDGTVMKSGKDMNVNDSVIIDDAKAVKKVLKIGSGCRCIVVDGVHVGSAGAIKEMHAGTSTAQASATIEQENGSVFDTLLKNIMVVE